YNSAGTYSVSVTATDENGRSSVPATMTIAISLATVIPITADWLQQNGPGPYVLSQANTTYVLQSDVTTSGTAFVIANKNAKFDLNGHKITYNNAQPIAVPNGDFEADPVGATTITGWTTVGAPNSSLQIAPNNVYLFGSKVLQWTIPNGAGPQVIQSSPI